MRLYLYSENCAMKGRVAGSEDVEGEEEELEANGDLFLYGDVTAESLIADALGSLAVRYDKRPGGAGDSFRWRCDRNVLAYLGYDLNRIDFDAETMTYLPLPVGVADGEDE